MQQQCSRSNAGLRRKTRSLDRQVANVECSRLDQAECVCLIRCFKLDNDLNGSIRKEWIDRFDGIGAIGSTRVREGDRWIERRRPLTFGTTLIPKSLSYFTSKVEVERRAKASGRGEAAGGDAVEDYATLRLIGELCGRVVT